MAHWVWGGGFLQEMGAIDFAGGTVVHINAGVAALVHLDLHRSGICGIVGLRTVLSKAIFC